MNTPALRAMIYHPSAVSLAASTHTVMDQHLAGLLASGRPVVLVPVTAAWEPTCDDVLAVYQGIQAGELPGPADLADLEREDA